MNNSDRDALPSIIKADPRHKQLVILLLLGILVAGVVLHLTLRPYLEHWVNVYEVELPQKSREEILGDYKFFTTLLSLTFVMPVALLGAVFLYQGYRVYHSGQYPYPRMMILRDTPLETGFQARRRGRRFLVVGGVAIISGGFLSWFLYTTLMRLLLSGNA